MSLGAYSYINDKNKILEIIKIINLIDKTKTFISLISFEYYKNPNIRKGQIPEKYYLININEQYYIIKNNEHKLINKDQIAHELTTFMNKYDKKIN